MSEIELIFVLESSLQAHLVITKNFDMIKYWTNSHLFEKRKNIKKCLCGSRWLIIIGVCFLHAIKLSGEKDLNYKSRIPRSCHVVDIR